MANNWKADTWLNATLDEVYGQSKDITTPPAMALVKAFGILQSTRRDLRIIDNGAGMGQVTDALISLSPERHKSMEIVCGDINDGLLSKLRDKKQGEGWASVQINHIDATVSPPTCNVLSS
jgi:ubiquinone/menaquinone biosynthesis C-methylase UbiE